MTDRPSGGATQALGIAWTMGWPIAAGVGVGYWLDQTFATSPWLTLLFSLAAFAGAVRRLILLSSIVNRSGPGRS